MRASGFFEGIRQTKLVVSGYEFQIPAFYPDGEQMTGVFAARMSVLRKMMPDRRLSPARIAPGVGAITITCFEYRQSDIDPYNELAVGVMLNEPFYRPNLPGVAMLSALRRGQYDSWVHQLPVTTEWARVGGVDAYNFPKFNASIDYEQNERTRTCRLAEGAEHILTLNCPRIQSNRTESVQIFTHSYQNREPQGAEFKILAHNMGRSIRPGAARLELGDNHPISKELSRALISTHSIAAAYSPRIEGILYGPHHLTPEVLDRVIDLEALRSSVA